MKPCECLWVKLSILIGIILHSLKDILEKEPVDQKDNHHN